MQSNSNESKETASKRCLYISGPGPWPDVRVMAARLESCPDEGATTDTAEYYGDTMGEWADNRTVEESIAQIHGLTSGLRNPKDIEKHYILLGARVSQSIDVACPDQLGSMMDSIKDAKEAALDSDYYQTSAFADKRDAFFEHWYDLCSQSLKAIHLEYLTLPAEAASDSY